MRRDKDGNLRELHVDKALAVLSPTVYEGYTRDEKTPEIIGKCDYFETAKYKLNFTNKSFFVGKDSFMALTAIRGGGSACGVDIKAGDTLFCPAGAGEISVVGEELELITVRVPKEKNKTRV